MSIHALKCLNLFTKMETISNRHVLSKTILGSILASHGLINNSLTSLIPAMLISPIGSLLIKSATNIIELIINPKIGVINSFPIIVKFVIVLMVTIGIGYAYGFGYNKYNPKDLPSKEMKARAEPSGLIEGTLIVIACAFAFPWASKHGDVTTLIAIGIATALLPPLVNIGLVQGSYDADPNTYKEKHWLYDSRRYGAIIFGINAIGLVIGSIIYYLRRCHKLN